MLLGEVQMSPDLPRPPKMARDTRWLHLTPHSNASAWHQRTRTSKFPAIHIKTQTSPTKSLKVMVSKAINSRVSIQKASAGDQRPAKSWEKADSSCLGRGHECKQTATFPAKALWLLGFPKRAATDKKINCICQKYAANN